MPIKTESRYFGEGINNYGVEKAEDAFDTHRHHVREKRLEDLNGKDTKLSSGHIARNFESIAAAIKAADEQVAADNADFIKKHKIEMKG